MQFIFSIRTVCIQLNLVTSAVSSFRINMNIEYAIGFHSIDMFFYCIIFYAFRKMSTEIMPKIVKKTEFLTNKTIYTHTQNTRILNKYTVQYRNRDELGAGKI